MIEFMSDLEQVTIDPTQFKTLEKRLNAYGAQLQIITERLGPVDKDKSIQKTLDDGFRDLSKWLSIQNDSMIAGFALVAEALTKPTLPPPQPNQLEVRFMFVVKDDNPDVNFSLVLGEVKDAEGNVIPEAKVTTAVLSSDENVVSVTFDPSTNSGSVHFGAPGTASITATVSTGETLLGSGAADFTVTLGDPAAISGVALNFEGLTEAPPPVEG
jgi:hypothetical protein